MVAAPPKVLIALDDDERVGAARAVLEGAGFVVETAGTLDGGRVLASAGAPAGAGSGKAASQDGPRLAALAKIAERFEQVGALCSEFLWEIDLAGCYTYVSSAAEVVIGYRPDELVGKLRCYELYPEQGREAMAASILAAIATGEVMHDFERRVQTKDGRLVWVSTNAVPVFAADGALIGYRGCSTDVTARLLAEAALKESEAKYRAIFQQARDGIALVELATGRFVEFNDAACAALGYTRAEFRALSVDDLEPLGGPQVRRNFDALLAKGQATFGAQARNRAGEVREVSISARVMILAGRSYALAIVHDMTEDRHAQRAVQFERDRLMGILRAMPEAVFIVDREHRILFTNPAFDRQFGPAIGRCCFECFFERETPCPSCDHAGVLVGRSSRKEWRGAPRGRQYDIFETPFTGPDGEIVGVMTIMRDVTAERQADAERARLEEQLRQAQKMEAVGKLAGGVAHDFNNMLHVILGYTSLVEADLDQDHPAREALAEVAQAARRGAKVVSQLLAFSRRQTMRAQDLDLNDVVSNLVKMVDRLIGERIRLEVVTSRQPALAHADRGMLEQVLLNLCLNARDAMPDGGTVTITTSEVLADEQFHKANPWARHRRYVQLMVVDTGCGMDAETLEHLFEPFFSTKEPGGGSGLGLATAYGLVRQHEGMIHAHSAPGQGSTFTVLLPAVDSEWATAAPSTRPVVGGQETILLAEDEPSVRELTARVLRRAGYTVLVAGDGAAAIALFEANRAIVSLLVLDVVMPGVRGGEVLDSVRRLNPGIPVLFASGYGEDMLDDDIVRWPGLRLLKKPYDSATLLQQVRGALDAAR